MDDNLRAKTLVLFLTAGMSLDAWHKGGMLTREIAIYNELAGHLNKIYFLTYGDEKELQYRKLLADNIEILSNKNTMNTPAYSFLAPFIHRRALKSADFFKTNQMLGSWTAVIAKLLFRKKLLVRQGYQLSTFWREKSLIRWFVSSAIEFLSYKLAYRIIVTSQRDKEFIVKRYRVKHKKINVFPNYVDTESFKPLEIEKDHRRVTFVGRLDEQKNLISLINAVKDLNIKLVLIGEGPLDDSLKGMVEENGIENVIFTGLVPNDRLPEELNRSEIFILPSLYEGNPKTLLEAMACGLPVIGTEVVGIKEVIKHKQNGYLCETSTESIREAIMYLMDEEKLKGTLGANARNTIIEDCSLKKLVKRELKMYGELLR